MGEKLSPEYFKLIRDVLREKKDEPQRPLKRKRGRQPPKEPPEVIKVESSSPEPETIEIESTDELFGEPNEKNRNVVKSSNDEHYDEGDDGNYDNDDNDDNDYQSDEFEDVTEPTGSPEPLGDISVSLETRKTDAKVTKKARNVVSNDERHWRRYFHMTCLIGLMVHGYVRNDWINNIKLQKKLCKLVPDKILQNLHPEKDEELPLRSTRKLLDGLKMCMEIWNKHWKITKSYEGTGCYMKLWDEIRVPYNKRSRLTEKEFVKQVLKGVGDRDMAAQGFVALLRSCNVNARLIMSLQPPDFCDLKVTDTRSRHVSPSTLFKYPIFWCEVWDKFSKKWITIDAINLKTIEQIKTQSKLEPRGTGSYQRNLLRYVIGFDRKKGVRDVTRRYSYWFNCKCIRKRITKDSYGDEWYAKVLKRLHERKRTRMDDYEDEYFQQRDDSEGMPDNIQDLKNHPKYILEKDLRINQIVKPGCKECGYLNVHNKKDLWKVYERKNILDLKSARQWYMEGRILKVGCRSMKKVPKRSRSAKEEDEEENLYSREDTELYVPPLASEPDGKIVKNAFGNIEVFVPSMIPYNCVLIKSDLAVKAARLLHIEHARAVTSFKFEKGRSTKPVIGGIVVARWFKDAVLCAIEGLENTVEQENFERRELENLTRWNLLLVKLRIKSELNTTYGKVEEVSKGVNGNGALDASDHGEDDDDEMMAGGFIVAGNEAAPVPQPEPELEDNHEDEFEEEQEQAEPTHSVDLQDGQDDHDSYDEFMDELNMSEQE
ncbi:hypothetical protein ZYGR_0H03250 [Zygosaccharomyces rouxii]|uniref:ZYRO0B11572p n=2 Tax=Zygosaccharomyces rouxii TaxID=4956 RepID=C5DRV1_ZYGRC|nr:uncharacterized protein ZYRO0B11572g [Zygosaccharomyces rouxii]KAH9199958.1 hypothetical protein LQ764DRAFT_111216 [Zygosaccharomyces rouxii]GAV47482.1 hypothetical protein ZYGR_0H03250 [Zygosaccharomyces rouxii]CAR26512.1 ZYRO0B11572p [Zygosaccharomyces rouxii]